MLLGGMWCGDVVPPNGSDFARPAALYFWEALQEQSGLLTPKQGSDSQKSISKISTSYVSRLHFEAYLQDIVSRDRD